MVVELFDFVRIVADDDRASQFEGLGLKSAVRTPILMGEEKVPWDFEGFAIFTLFFDDSSEELLHKLMFEDAIDLFGRQDGVELSGMNAAAPSVVHHLVHVHIDHGNCIVAIHAADETSLNEGAQVKVFFNGCR